MKDSTATERYKSKSIPELRKLAQKLFNAFIRRRDDGKPCISCGTQTGIMQAGHFYSAGHHPGLALDEDNCHNQCVRCNTYLSGNLIEYQKGLIQRIGGMAVGKLHTKAEIFKREGYKHDRFVLIQAIIKYR